MKRIVIAVSLLVAVMTLVTCERANMYELASLGLAPKTAIYIYAVGPVTGALNGRKSVDEKCYNEGTLFHGLTGAGTVKAFISTSIFDEIRLLMPGEYWSYPVIGITSLGATTVIAATWAGMLTGNTSSGIDAAVGIATATPNVWWSGSRADGSFDTTANCNSWSIADTTQSGMTGAALFNSASVTCDNSAYLLCIAY